MICRINICGITKEAIEIEINVNGSRNIYFMLF